MVPLPPPQQQQLHAQQIQHPQQQLQARQHQPHSLSAQDVDDIALLIIPLTIEGRRASTPTWRHVRGHARRANPGAHIRTRGIPAFLESAEPTTCFLDQLDLEIYDLDNLQPPRSRRLGRLRARREQMHQTPSRSHHRRRRLLHPQRSDLGRLEHARQQLEHAWRRIQRRLVVVPRH